MKVLLYSPQYRPNMSSMIRTAEFYGLDTIYIYDGNGLLTPPTTKKERAHMQHMGRVWTAGAADHIEVELVENVAAFIEEHSGRKIGTLVSDTAQTLQSAKPTKNDLIIFGPEKEGLPDDIIKMLDVTVWIPHRGHTDCLNVAVTFGIVVNKWIIEID